MLQLIRKQTSKLLTKKKIKNQHNSIYSIATLAQSLYRQCQREPLFEMLFVNPSEFHWEKSLQQMLCSVILGPGWALALQAQEAFSLLSLCLQSTVLKPSGWILGNFWLLPEPPVVVTLLNGNSRQKSEHGYCKTSRMQSREVSVGLRCFYSISATSVLKPYK